MRDMSNPLFGGVGGFGMGQNGGIVPPQQPQGFGGFLQGRGYTGPMPGTPEFQQARASGQHPIMDWMRSQHPQWGMGQGFMPQGQGMGQPMGLAGLMRRPMPGPLR